MLAQEPADTAGVASGPVRHRVLEHLRLAIRNDDQAESDSAAQPPAVGELARPRSHGHVHGIGHRKAVQTLEHDCEPEHPLELHDDRWLVASDTDDVTALDLALHVVALAGEQALHRLIQVGLGRIRSSGAGHRHTVPQPGAPGIETAPGKPGAVLRCEVLVGQPATATATAFSIGTPTMEPHSVHEPS